MQVNRVCITTFQEKTMIGTLSEMVLLCSVCVIHRHMSFYIVCIMTGSVWMIGQLLFYVTLTVARQPIRYKADVVLGLFYGLYGFKTL